MRIYVASSWRCARQPLVVAALRGAGHEVYDFRHPAADNDGFRWSEIDPDWQRWDAERFRAALAHPIAERGFGCDRDALAAADACVLVQPCGRSAALELGWAAGAGKRTCVLLADGSEPELMIKLAGAVVTTMEELIAWSLGRLGR